MGTSTHAEGDVIPIERIADLSPPFGETDGRSHPKDVRARLQRTYVEVLSSNTVSNLICTGGQRLERRSLCRERRGNSVTFEPKTDVLKIWMVGREKRVDMPDHRRPVRLDAKARGRARADGHSQSRREQSIRRCRASKHS